MPKLKDQPSHMPPDILLREYYIALHPHSFDTEEFGTAISFLLQQEAEGVHFTPLQLQELARGQSEFDFQMSRLATPKTVEELRQRLQREANRASIKDVPYNSFARLEEIATTTSADMAAPAIALLQQMQRIDSEKARELLAASLMAEAAYLMKNREENVRRFNLALGTTDQKNRMTEWITMKDKDIAECWLIIEAIRNNTRHFPHTHKTLRSHA